MFVLCLLIILHCPSVTRDKNNIPVLAQQRMGCPRPPGYELDELQSRKPFPDSKLQNWQHLRDPLDNLHVQHVQHVDYGFSCRLVASQAPWRNHGWQFSRESQWKTNGASRLVGSGIEGCKWFRPHVQMPGRDSWLGSSRSSTMSCFLKGAWSYYMVRPSDGPDGQSGESAA